MRSAFALRPSLHAFACALTRRVYGVGLCGVRRRVGPRADFVSRRGGRRPAEAGCACTAVRRMSSEAASDSSHGDRALHEHVNPLPCVSCVPGHFHVSVPGVGAEGVARVRGDISFVYTQPPHEQILSTTLLT